MLPGARAIYPALLRVQIIEDVNIRRRPRANSSVLGAALAGEAVDLVDCTGDLGWYFVSCPAKQMLGWVDSRYLESIPLLTRGPVGTILNKNNRIEDGLVPITMLTGSKCVAFIDRLIYRIHKIALKGESMRKVKTGNVK